MDVTEVYDQLTGKRTNQKSKVFSTHPTKHKEELAALHYGPHNLECTNAEKLVGVEHSFRKQRGRKVLANRGDTCIDTARRIAGVPRGLRDKARLAAGTAGSQFAFGVEFGHPRIEDLRECRQAIVNAIWTTTGHQKAVEILLTLLVRGDQTDPMQRIQVETLMHLSRLLRKHEGELRAPFEEMWEEASNSPQPRGPIGTAMKVLKE